MFYRNLHTVLHVHVIMHEIETWAPGSAAHALCVINISSHETGRPAGRGGGGPGPMGPPPGSAPAVCMPDCARCQNRENTHRHTDTQTDRHTDRTSTVTLAHARRGLIIIILQVWCSLKSLYVLWAWLQ